MCCRSATDRLLLGSRKGLEGRDVAAPKHMLVGGGTISESHGADQATALCQGMQRR